MAIEKIIALDNLENVLTDKDIPANVEVDPVTANAYIESKKAAEHVEEVKEELEERAEEIATKNPEEPEVKGKDMYTTKLTLDESLEDFDINADIKKRVNDEDDRYLDFDMFDFIYNLFSSETDSLIRPKKALSNIKSKRGRSNDNDKPSFNYSGFDSYTKGEDEDNAALGTPQISSDMDGNILLYKDNESDFDIVIDLCNEYKLKYEGPVSRRATWVRWAYSFKIYVPTYSDGMPMSVEDYFEDIGIPLEEVMPQDFISKREASLNKDTDNSLIDTIYDKWVKKAARSNDPLDIFIKSMFNEMSELDINYSSRKKELKDKFIAEFDDNFGDDE